MAKVLQLRIENQSVQTQKHTQTNINNHTNTQTQTQTNIPITFQTLSFKEPFVMELFPHIFQTNKQTKTFNTDELKNKKKIFFKERTYFIFYKYH